MSDTSNLIHLKMARLLCSRLCHDLAGPVGAINAGLELLEDSTEGTAEATALAADSARQITDRLAFYRIAFGLGGGDGSGGAFLARQLSAGLLAGGRVVLDWPEDVAAEESLPTGSASLLLNLILLGVDMLPRGGALSVRLATLEEGTGVAVTAAGPGARFKDVIRAAMAPQVSMDDLTARNVHGYFATKLAENLGADIEISVDGENEVRLAVLMPHSDG